MLHPLLKTARLTLFSLTGLTMLFAIAGCFGGTRVVYVQSGQPVRLRQTVKQVDIWAEDKDGKSVPGKIDLPEGWYALPDPGPKK